MLMSDLHKKGVLLCYNGLIVQNGSPPFQTVQKQNISHQTPSYVWLFYLVTNHQLAN